MTGLRSASSATAAAAATVLKRRLWLRTGVCSLPRQQRSPSPIEDAFFTAHVDWPPAPAAAGAAAHGIVSYVGVADGVGSWRARGVDPRLYAQRLMEHASEAVWAASLAGAQPPTPAQVLTAAWSATNAGQVVGSATAVVLLLDGAQRLLAMHGVGDCGVLLLRATAAGTGAARIGAQLAAPAERRGGALGWHVVARATQQMVAFNQPFQLGWAPEQEARFQTPRSGETLALPVQPGDLVIAASDGLFDNLGDTYLLSIVEAWSRSSSSPHAAGDAARVADATPASRSHEPPVAASEAGRARQLDGACAAASALAQQLAHRAAALSVDRTQDGPFALLAKENDVLWTKGGRPDDVTVAVAMVVGDAPQWAPLTLEGVAARRGAAQRAVPLLSYDDPTVTGNVSHAVATAECGEDATWRVLPQLLRLQREAALARPSTDPIDVPAPAPSPALVQHATAPAAATSGAGELAPPKPPRGKRKAPGAGAKAAAPWAQA